MISPLQDQVEAKGIGVKWINADGKIKAQPVLVSVWQMNTDWMRQNEDAARKFVRATLRGVRDYCNAYHRGPNRAEITRILAKYSDVKDPALIDRIEWGATDVQGRIFEASVTRYPGHVRQGEARRRQSADRQARTRRLGGRGCGGPRAVQARP